MASYSEVAQRWVDRCLGKTDRPAFRSNGRMYESNGRIWSYGSHFELGRLIRDDRGRPHTWLLNGDRFSVTTSKHQGIVRGAVATTGIPSLIVPYTALGSAGITLDTIRLLAVEDDRWEPTHHRIPGTFGGEDDVSWLPVTLGYQNRKDQVGVLRSDLGEVIEVHRSAAAGERIEDAPAYTRYTPPVRMHDVMAEQLGDGQYQWTTSRHFLGASVFQARVSGERRRSRWLSGFDENERRDLYYLARLPASSRASTYKQALEDLAPRAVHAALAQGRDVKRQGDMFAIPVSLTTREVKARAVRVEKRVGVHRTDHVCTEVAVCKRGVTYARGTMRHQPGGRRPDHAMLSLGKEWHLIVRNTVPAQKRRTRAFA